MSINRALAPEAAPVNLRPFPPFEAEILGGGVPVYFVRYGAIPVVEVQVVFQAGNCYEPSSGVASMTARMLTEGTRRKSGFEIAQFLDFYGASIKASAGSETVTLTLSTLTRRLPETFALLSEIIYEATLPENEFETERKRALQNYEIEEEKTEFRARKRFLQTLFPARHPYGRVTDAQSIKNFQLDDLRRYKQTHFRPGNSFIIVAGDFDPEAVLGLLAEYDFNSAPRESFPPPADLYTTASVGQRIFEPAPGKMQSSIRLGSDGNPRNHPDHHKIKFVTLLLGGYFGARLMQNIREEKGYTYGVYAQWNALKYAGYLAIGTDLANEYVEPAIVEIRKEMVRLREEPIGEEELLLAKNYYAGSLLSYRETPFQIADTLKNLIVNELDASELETGPQTILNMNADDVQAIAQKYFHVSDLIEVVCGGEPVVS